MNQKATKTGRIGAILALVGSSIFVQLPIELEKLNWVGVLLFIAAFMSWLSIEIAGTEPQANEDVNQARFDEDVEKFNIIVSMIDKKQFYTLNRTHIQTYMERDSYRGLSDLVHYHENDIFSFHNTRIQAAYEKLVKDAESFLSEFFDLYGSDGRGGMTWRLSGDGWVSDEDFEKIMARIGTLDRKASALASQWERLIVLARGELKGASKAIASYEP